MWQNLEVSEFSVLEKLVAEYTIGTVGVLSSPTMKVRVYENVRGTFIGVTEVQIKMKFDGLFKGGIGHGATEEETLSNTLKYFYEMIEENYPDRDETGLKENEMRFNESCEF